MWSIYFKIINALPRALSVECKVKMESKIKVMHTNKLPDIIFTRLDGKDHF